VFVGRKKQFNLKLPVVTTFPWICGHNKGSMFDMRAINWMSFWPLKWDLRNQSCQS